MCKYNQIGVFLAAQKIKAMDDLKNAPWPLIKETASPTSSPKRLLKTSSNELPYGSSALTIR
jgi:hypothetical protein